VIGHGRLTFVDPGAGILVGTFGVDDRNGWVTQWRDSDPDVVEAMYPPTAVAGLGFTRVSETEIRYWPATSSRVRETVRVAIAAAFAEVGL
jgi:hypothetical protein